MKTCNRCNKTKTYENFRSRKDSKDGYRNQCRVCIEEMRTERRHDPIRSLQEREWNLQRLYGITGEDYDKLLEVQNERCAICDTHYSEVTGRFKRLCVDHCHDTGKIRGLLCNNCNRSLGLLKDNAETLLEAYRYLTK